MSLYTLPVDKKQATHKPSTTKETLTDPRKQALIKALATQTQTVKADYSTKFDTCDLTEGYKDGLLSTHTLSSAGRLHDCFTPDGASIMWSKNVAIPELLRNHAQDQGKDTKLDVAKAYIKEVAFTIRHTYLLVNILESGTKLPKQVEGRARSKMPYLGHTET